MKTKLYLVALVLLTILFASCDSLWQVGESTDVSMSINLHDIAGGSLFLGDDDDGFDEEFDDGSYTSFDIVVSLHNAANNSVIDSQTEKNTPSDSTGDIVFTFKAVPINLEAYAAIHIYGNATGGERTLIFSAQSNNTTIKIGKNNIVARPNVLFYADDKLTYVLGSGNGIESGNNVEILDAAFEALGGRNNLAPNATVVMNGSSIQIDSAATRDYGGLRLLRGENTQNLLKLVGGAVEISSLVLDGGNKGGLSLINNGNAASTILTNVVIKNNNAGDNNGAGIYNYGTLTMNNCTVTGNTSNFEGGGIYSNNILTLNNCTVTKNTTTNNGGGVYSNGGILVINGGVYSNNSGNEGGAIWSITASNSKYFAISGNVEITHNTATTNGGGIYNDNDNAYDVSVGDDSSKQFVLGSGVLIAHNTANQDGGGLYTKNARARINGAHITHNRASNRGGGVYNSSNNSDNTNAGYGSITIDAGVISNNSTNTGEENTGPGVYSGANGTIIKNGGSITDLTYQE